MTQAEDDLEAAVKPRRLGPIEIVKSMHCDSVPM